MTEQKIPDFWWTPSRGLIARTPGGYYLCGPTADPTVFFELPGDAVQLVPAPPTPRVFLPGDTVAAGTEVWTKDRNVYRWGADRQLQPYEGPMVEVLYPSPEEWQAAVDGAQAEREGARCGLLADHVGEHKPPLDPERPMEERHRCTGWARAEREDTSHD